MRQQHTEEDEGWGAVSEKEGIGQAFRGMLHPSQTPGIVCGWNGIVGVTVFLSDTIVSEIDVFKLQFLCKDPRIRSLSAENGKI